MRITPEQRMVYAIERTQDDIKNVCNTALPEYKAINRFCEMLIDNLDNVEDEYLKGKLGEG